MISEHGDDYQGQLIANFSSNIWHAANHEGLYQQLLSKLTDIKRYPEIDAASLKKIIAEKHLLNPNQISIGNGSTEIIYRIAQTFQSNRSLIVTPTFSEYYNACNLSHHLIVTCKLEDVENSLQLFNPNLIWICNPNNPDGNFIPYSHLRLLCSRYKNMIFIIDQSYAGFCKSDNEEPDFNSLSNVIVVRSLTKRYSIPGLRIGYALGNKSIIGEINRYYIPWSVNSIAIEAAKYFLTNNDNFSLDELLVETQRMRNLIDSIDFFQTLPTNTSFFLVKLEKGKASELKSHLLTKGILIRDANNFMIDEGEYIRINTLDKINNNLLINELKEWSKTKF
jgi:threonine-phosphate decarboxylase